MVKSILIFILSAVSTLGATYYVETNGNNAADGSLATPWSNVWYAAKTVAAGDTVIIKAGEYNEFVTNTVTGTAANPITFVGERGAGGEWLTIIDPSTPYTNGWVAATEIGEGVYKQTGMPFDTQEMSINHKRLGFVFTTNDMSFAISSAYVGSGLTSGSQLLLLASNAVLTTAFSGSNVNFWDGIEALYNSTNRTTYLRLRDGSNPNGLNIRCSPNYDDHYTLDQHRPAITVSSKSYLTFSNLLVRGAISGIWMSDAHHVNIESNYLAGGISRINISGVSYSNNIVNNSLTTDFYGYTNTGAWNGSLLTNYVYVKRENTYLLSKFLMGNGSHWDHAVWFGFISSSNNIVSGNHIYDTIGNGILIYGADGGGDETKNTIIRNNFIEHHCSAAIFLEQGQFGTQIFDNTISDCNSNIRIENMNRAAETNRTMYIYRNTFWIPSDPEHVGAQVYFHFYDFTNTSFYPSIWFYHNSFSGGRHGLMVSGYAAPTGGLALTRAINNIFSGCNYYVGNVAMDFWTNSTMFSAFDYNMITPVSWPTGAAPAWMAVHNVTNLLATWTDADRTFRLPVGSAAINRALDVTVPFTIGTSNYSALPADSTVKIGPAWDMGALEAGYVGNIGTLRVGTLRGP